MATVSVIIPVFNGDQTISKALSSVLSQTFQDFEILIIEDGSTDQTLQRIHAFQDSRIHIFTQPNQGVIVSRNLGIHQSQGKYIAFLDADDVWLPNKLADQLAALRANPNAAVVYCWNNHIDEKDQLLRPGWHLTFNGFVYVDLLHKNFIEVPSSLMVTREAARCIGGFDSELKQLEDWDFLIRLAEHYEFCCVPKVGTLYRQQQGSRSTQTLDMEADGQKILHRSIKKLSKLRGFAFCQQQRVKAEAFADFYSYLFYVDFQKIRDRKATIALLGLLMRGLWISPKLWQKIPKKWILLVIRDVFLTR